MEGRSGHGFKNILLTGRPGVGKTTALMAAVEAFRGSAGGFYTEEIREKGERTGFSIVTLSGGRRVMASKTFKSPRRVGKYGVDVEAIDSMAAASIEDAIKEKGLIVIDEIGKMELYSEKFRDAVVKALDSDKPVAGVIMENANEFVDSIKKRNDVLLIEITVENRDKAPGLLRAHLEMRKKIT